jgi:hypothetical protein
VSGRIALAAGTACILLLGALGLYVGTILASAGSVCPGAEPASTGFETLSAWPPGQRCISGASSTVSSEIPWAAPIVVVMLCGAGAVILFGIAAQIGVLRRHVPTAAALRQPEAAAEPEPAIPLEAVEDRLAAEARVPSEAAVRVLRDAA